MSALTKFLELTYNISLVDDRIANFGDSIQEFNVARHSGAKCPLNSLGVVAITGSDARDFINAQFTTNCLELTEVRSQLSGWCDPKGRVLFLFTLYCDNDHLLAILPRAQTATFLQRLRMYILRAQVELRDVSDAVTVIGLIDAPGVANPGYPDLVAPWDSKRDSDSRTIVRYGPGPIRYLIVSDSASALLWWQELEIQEVGEDAWLAFDSYAGMPRVDVHNSGKFLPQNLNLDSLAAVSFSKGCYPGQEVVARLKYRGKVKKRLIAAEYASDSEIAAGAALRVNGDDRLVGEVLAVQRIGASRSVLSAVVDISVPLGDMKIEGSTNVALEQLTLPYEIA
jgi:folate-binding protein YgfZ